MKKARIPNADNKAGQVMQSCSHADRLVAEFYLTYIISNSGIIVK